MYRLSRIVIYPIKSLDGLSLDEVQVLPSSALANDRRYAIRDARGSWVNGKANPLIPGLRARFTPDAGGVQLTSQRDNRQAEFHLPAELPALSAWLSEYFAQPVMMVEESRTGFPDDTDSPGPTLVSRQTIEEVARWFPGMTPDEVRARFRANLEIEGDAPFCEDRLVAGEQSVVRFELGAVSFEGVTPCQRCVVPTRNPQTAEVYPHFARQFAEQRAATLPAWTVRERFDHFYRLTVNTRLSPLSKQGHLRVGDELSITSVVPA